MNNNNDVKGQSLASVPLAIVGVGCMFPQADNAGVFWTNIRNGVDGISEVPESHWRPEDYFDQDPKAADKVYSKLGGFLSPVEFNPMDYGILPNSIEAIDTSQLLGLLTVEQALANAGYAGDKEFDRDRVSVILGVTGALELVIPLGARLGHPRWRQALADAGVDQELAEDVVRRISDSYVPWQENSFPGLLGNVVAGRISKHFNFGGTNCVVDAACGSSLSALNLAALELAAGRSDMVVTGGIDTFNDIFMYSCFSKTPALSPSGHARPYSADSDGTTIGEGLGVVVLKRLSDAERDGDRIYAVVKGIGASSDGRGGAIYEPTASGQTKALRRAYEQAGIDPRSIELIEGHGTGTRVGDAIEVAALQEVFGPADQPWCALGSVKSQIGHTKAAAGSAGLIKAALALYHKVLPPTIKVDQPHESLLQDSSAFYLNTECRPWVANPNHPRRAGISALGFGGSNFHCLLEEYQPEKAAVDWSGDVQPVPFSAATIEQLKQAVNDFPVAADWRVIRAAAAAQRQSFDCTAQYRLVAVLDRRQADPVGPLKTCLTQLAKQAEQSSWETPDGAYFASGPVGGKVALLFPGQGAQYPGMLADLALQFPEFFAVLEQADRSFSAAKGQGSGALAGKLYPRPQFDQAGREACFAALQATDLAQPALGAVSLGAMRVLNGFGLQGDAFAGHSYGELAALCCAGALAEQDLYRLSKLRGELMAAGDGDRGTMLAVSAPLAEIVDFINNADLDLVLANRNTPTQGVLSGATSEIEKAARLLEQQGIAHKRLSVSAAFHSALVAEAAQPFAAELAQVAFQPARGQVYSNTTGQAYPQDTQAMAELLSRQLASPVDFVAEVASLYRDGARIFVEVGPGARLVGMVKAILAEQPYAAVALDSSNGKRSTIHDLARLLARLASLGVNLDLNRWDQGYAATVATGRKKAGLTLTLSGANHFKMPAKRPPLARPQSQPTEPAATPALQPPAAVSTVANGPVGVSPTAPSQPAVASDRLQDALRMTTQSMQALQSLQEQTAKLHQQFLEGQQAATQSFMQLIEQQQQLLHGQPLAQSAVVPAAVAAPAAAPATQVVPAAVPTTSAAPLSASTVAASLPATPVAPAAASSIAPLLLEIIAEKTGYPVEMLELEMALDSDLGIDSIKRVEILSALQERLPQAPTIGPEDLGRLQTLGEIVAHLDAEMPGDKVATAVTGVSSATVDASRITGTLLAVVAEKTGYPQDMLELEMALDTDLGIDSIKRVEILSALQESLPELPPIKPEELGQLQTLGQIVAHLGSAVSVPASVATVAALAQPQVSRKQVSETLLAVVAEKTGYPVDMLEPEMALDTDLGIDSIKRVEILSALQEQLPDLPAVKPEDLSVLQTLAQIIDHLCRSQKPTAVGVAQQQPTSVDRGTVATTLLEVIAEKTGYPVEMLELDMALDTDLGIDSIKRVEILSALQERIPGAPAIKPEHLGTLQTVGQIVDFLASLSGSEETREPSSSQSVAAAKGISRQVLQTFPLPKKRPQKEFKFTSGAQVWITDDGSALSDELCKRFTARQLIPRKISLAELADLDIPEALAGLVMMAPLHGTSDRFLIDSFALLQKCEPALDVASGRGGAFIATVSRLNGCFGLKSRSNISDPLSGGLAGLCKTAALEWPSIHCKALDIAMGMEIEATAETLVNEIFLAGPLEVGVTSVGIQGLELVEQALSSQALELPVGAGDLVVISGGARGVTAEAAVALARASQATLLLLGRNRLSESESAWLNGLQDEAAIKKGILAHAAGPMKPKEVAQEYQRISAEREIRATLERILNAGGKALYRSVDLRDADQCRAVVAEAVAEYGPVRGVIHGAGVLADKLIKEKTLAQFDQVYATKVDGLRNLLASVTEADLQFLALYSSSTGRFGRIGQVDYAVANEVLNKIAAAEAEKLPHCRVLALNWGPWDGGMVTPELKKVFAREGVAVIDLQAGTDYLLQELSNRDGEAVELVISGAEEQDSALPTAEPQANIYVSKAFDLELSVEQYPFLKSHVMDGKAVLPVAIMVEWMAHGAIHNNPGLKFQGFNDLRVLKGVILAADSSYSLQVMTGKAIKSDGIHVVPVEISGTNGKGQVVPHARGRILLASALPAAKAALPAPELPAYNRDGEIYTADRLFHGTDFHGISRVLGCSSQGISVVAQGAPSPGQWIDQPLRSSWFADPLVLDSSFQSLILWSFDQYQAGSLPVFAERYRQYRERFPTSGTEIRVRLIERSASRAVAQIDFVDATDGSLVARIENYECVIDASLNATFQRNKLTGVA